jgi:hypothetical protein
LGQAVSSVQPGTHWRVGEQISPRSQSPEVAQFEAGSQLAESGRHWLTAAEQL